MEKPKKLKVQNRKSFCIATLRRSSYRWIPRNEARRLASRGRNKYVCAECGESIIYKKKETHLDHVHPVIPVETGYTTLDSFAERLLCEVDGFQVLCVHHHTVKTLEEKELRMYYRKLNKEKK